METEPVGNQSGKEAAEQKARACRLAVWSIVLGILGPILWILLWTIDATGEFLSKGPCVFVPLAYCAFGLPGLLLGRQSLQKIHNMGGSLRSERFARIGILVSKVWFLLIPIGFIWPVLSKEAAISKRMECAENLSVLGKAISIYANDNKGRYPTANKWCDLLVEGGYVNKKQLKCPGDKRGPCSYAMNPNAEPNSPEAMVLVFEAKVGWNQHGGPELWNVSNHEDIAWHVLFNDGHVELNHRDSVTLIMWKVEDSNGG